MSGRLSGKRAIITGASRGLGRAIALRFAAEKAEVALVGRSKTHLEETQKQVIGLGGTSWLQPTDVTSAADVDRLVQVAMQRWGGVDILVNNAGVIETEANFLDLAEASWAAVIDTNLRGVYLVGQRVARAMAAGGGGAIVNISSIDGLGADGSFAAYNTSKAGIYGLTRTMALDLASHGIRVNAVSPGYVDTEMNEIALGSELMSRMRADFRRAPMRRMVKPEEIASACLFLVSEDASAITGQNLVVDCGLTSNLYVVETLGQP
jgi:NAD(P)-dependent dehydrogenase (short-subunit alcohol dehydrogenase family)